MFWKNNSGGVYDARKATFRKAKSKFLINGVSDILGIMNGRFIAIEVKRPSTRKNVSRDQQSFLDKINQLGGLAFVATSIEDIEHGFKKEGNL